MSRMQIGYKNKDPGTETDGIKIAVYTADCFEKEYERLIAKKYYNRNWTPLALELRAISIDEALKIFQDKRLELIQLQRNNKWIYKSQDETYPDLQEDLRRYWPA